MLNTKVVTYSGIKLNVHAGPDESQVPKILILVGFSHGAHNENSYSL